ncbi:MAG: hypothetical protein JWP78_338 [Mucilaginibacter sp.]|nr:hypothetical protein [Mucilaginibacter sp.]
MNYLKVKSEIERKICPVHNIRPLVKIENGNLTLRCCCDAFTSECMIAFDRKLNKSETLLSIIDAWERDLFPTGRMVE